MRLILLLISLSSLYAITVNATEYIYRDLKANTLPSVKCEEKNDAVATALKQYNLDRYAKRFCQSQGYGWHVEKIQDTGTPSCEACGASDQGKERCHLEDVVVSCKLIRPGSVGMLPGKS
jgi:hypothetical protein